MTRMIDLMRRQTGVPTFDSTTKKWENGLFLSTVSEQYEFPVFVIDNVTQYMRETSTPADWSCDSSFPNIAPPFSEFFMETKIPDQKGVMMGIFFQAFSKPEQAPPKDGFFDKIISDTDPFGADCRWKLIVHSFHYSEGSAQSLVYRVLPIFIYDIRPDGSYHKAYSFGCESNLDTIFEISVSHYPFLLALTFMHCKNVEFVDVEPPPKLSKATERRKGVPLTRYKTLKIEPMKEEMRKQGAGTGEGTTGKALHLCRGHFKDYRERGLFGKIKELFWFGPQMRGSAENGEVKKIYEVLK